jgi:hypothetical protein
MRRDWTTHDRRRVNMQAVSSAAYVRKHLGGTSSLGPFKCEVCGKWHIGNDYQRMAQ